MKNTHKSGAGDFRPSPTRNGRKRLIIRSSKEAFLSTRERGTQPQASLRAHRGRDRSKMKQQRQRGRVRQRRQPHSMRPCSSLKHKRTHKFTLSASLTLQASRCLPPSADQDNPPAPPPPPKPPPPEPPPPRLPGNRGDSHTRDRPSKPPTTPSTGGLPTPPAPSPPPAVETPLPAKPQGLGMKFSRTSPTIFMSRACRGGGGLHALAVFDHAYSGRGGWGKRNSSGSLPRGECVCLAEFVLDCGGLENQGEREEDTPRTKEVTRLGV